MVENHRRLFGSKMRGFSSEGLQSIIRMSKGYFLTTVVNQALPFLLLPLLTRFLTTAEYGTLSLFSFYLAFCHAIVGASLPTVISKFYFEEDKKYVAHLVGNCIILSAILSCLVVAILGFACLSGVLNEAPFQALLLVPVGAFSLVTFALGLTICKNARKVFHFSCHQVGNTVMNVVFSLLTVCIFYFGWIGRFASISIAYVMSAFIMIIYLNKMGYISLGYSAKMMKDICRVAFPLIPNSVQMILIAQAGLYFMQLFFGKGTLGQYALAFQISTCIKLLVDTLNMSWTPFFFKQLSMDAEMDKKYVTRCLLWQLVILVSGVIFIDIMAYPILVIMATKDYYSATSFIPWLTLGWLFYGLYVFLKPILIKYDEQKFIGRTSFYSMLAMLVANILLARLCGALGISYSFSLVYLILVIPLIIRIQHICPLPWISAIKGK